MKRSVAPSTSGVMQILLAAAALVCPLTASADWLVGNFFGPGNEDVLRYSNTGAFVGTFVPSGSGGLSFPLGGAYGPDGNFYVSDSDHEHVLQYNGVTGAFQTIFGNAEDPAGLAFRANGHVLVADSSDPGEITELSPPPGSPAATFVAAVPGLLTNPEGLVLGPDGNLYVANNDSGNVLRFNGTTGAFLGVFASGLTNPRGVTFGLDGNLYVTNFGGADVLRFNGTTGALLNTFVTPGSGGLSLPRPLLFGPDGNLYVGSYGTGDILRYNGTTGAFIDDFIPAGRGGLGGPTFLVYHDFATGGGGSVPEPASLLLFVTASAIGLVARRRQRRS